VVVKKKSAQSPGEAEGGVEKVPLSSLQPRRRGKHHELMEQVLRELIALSSDTALKVPLGDTSAKDMRSAVSRAAASQNLRISSTSDDDHLYVWKKRS
jgi:hypothetical protein